MRISNLKVRTKLSVLVGIGCIGMFLVGAIGLTGIEKAGLLIFCLGILAFVGFSVSVSITKSLKSILDVLLKMADGDLTARCEVAGSDEIGMLAKEVNITSEKLETALTLLFPDLRPIRVRCLRDAFHRRTDSDSRRGSSKSGGNCGHGQRRNVRNLPGDCPELHTCCPRRHRRQ